MKEPNTEEMKNILPWLFNQLSRHGLSFVLLAGFVYYFQAQNMILQEKTDNCTERIIEMYQAQSEDTREVIKRNTEAITNFSFYLKENKNN